MTLFSLNLAVITDDENVAVKVWEVFSRAGAGLALDGVAVNNSISTIDESVDDEEGDAG
jgi:hypothetical protein